MVSAEFMLNVKFIRAGGGGQPSLFGEGGAGV